MPNTITIGAFVLGAVLLLLGLAGGQFKIFSAEVNGRAGKFARTLAFVLGVLLVGFGLMRETGVISGATQSPDPRPDSATSKTVPSEAKQPAVIQEVVPNVAGRWHDGNGTIYDISQERDSFHFTAETMEGLETVGSGTLTGYEFENSFTTNYPSTGSGRGTISRDGRQISGRFRDSYFGEYTLVLYR